MTLAENVLSQEMIEKVLFDKRRSSVDSHTMYWETTIVYSTMQCVVQTVPLSVIILWTQSLTHVAHVGIYFPFTTWQVLFGDQTVCLHFVLDSLR